MSSQNIYFISFAGDNMFIFIQLQHIPFILIYSLFESDADLFIYFPRDPGQNIYFKVFEGQDIYFK